MPASAYPGSPDGIKVVLLGGVLSSCVPLRGRLLAFDHHTSAIASRDYGSPVTGG